ncbi:MAG: hypothetical protein WBS24_11170 [Terriglobales bacterium]
MTKLMNLLSGVLWSGAFIGTIGITPLTLVAQIVSPQALPTLQDIIEGKDVEMATIKELQRK